MIKETNKRICSTERDKGVLKALRLKEGMGGAGPKEMREEAKLAVERLMSFDWTHLTSESSLSSSSFGSLLKADPLSS